MESPAATKASLRQKLLQQINELKAKRALVDRKSEDYKKLVKQQQELFLQFKKAAAPTEK